MLCFVYLSSESLLLSCPLFGFLQFPLFFLFNVAFSSIILWECEASVSGISVLVYRHSWNHQNRMVLGDERLRRIDRDASQPDWPDSPLCRYRPPYEMLTVELSHGKEELVSVACLHEIYRYRRRDPVDAVVYPEFYSEPMRICLNSFDLFRFGIYCARWVKVLFGVYPCRLYYISVVESDLGLK